MLEKKKIHIFNNDYYLLGADNEGTKYYLQKAKFECGWYWGVGYVETFTNNKNPEHSRDISSHQHFDTLFLCKDYRDFIDNEYLVDSPFTDKEKWKILEIMKSLYIARKYSDFLHCGGAHCTENPVKNVIKNDEEYQRINNVVIPALLEELESILID